MRRRSSGVLIAAGACLAAAAACGQAFDEGPPDAQVVPLPDASLGADQTIPPDSTAADAGAFEADATLPPPPAGDASDGAVLVAVDAPTCTPGLACNPSGGACVTGVTSCAGGQTSCDVTDLPPGTPCGSGGVCANGTCNACTAGADCSVAGSCQVQAVVCTSGASVCTPMGNAAPGTPCTSASGGDSFCDSTGSCVACADGNQCPPADNPCNVGRLTCAGGTSSCTDTGTPVAGGTPCGANHVCDGSGACVACQAGATCFTGNDGCEVGSISCLTGQPVCTNASNLAAGTACDAGGASGVCDNGTCNACAPNQACSPNGNTCELGATGCTTGVPVCNPTGPVANGTSCNGGAPYSTCENGQCAIQDACTAEIADSGEAFVAPGGSGTACTMAAPCGSFTVALANLAGRTKVYVQEGTYTESFALSPGVTIQGGWLDAGGTWMRDCAPTAAANTTIQSDGTQPWAISYTPSTQATSTLDTLTVRSGGLAAPPLASAVYGIFVSGTASPPARLNVQNVDVTAGSASGGIAGPAGTNGTTAANCTCAAAGSGTGAQGANGTALGIAPGPGMYGPNGFTPFPAGDGASASGSPGGAGGAAPPAPVYTISVNSCGGTAPSAYCNGATTYTTAGEVGNCGCGGNGGGGGLAGGSGGSSVALFSYDVEVTMTGGSLTSGNGGTGGAGGSGGLGGPGQPGQTGATGQGSCSCNVNKFGQCTSSCGAGEPGSTGGAGGAGGNGAQGAGGRGGDSYCYVSAGLSGTVTTTGVTFTPGAAGAGGAPSPGSVGTSAPHPS